LVHDFENIRLNNIPSMSRPPLPPRLVLRLKSESIRKKKREEFKYGALDKLFNVIFCKESHMVKPQGPIRSEAAELDPDTSIANSNTSIVADTSMSSNDSMASFDSYGCELDDVDWAFPDFTVCEYSASATEDKAILIVEVKKKTGDFCKGHEQMLEYLDAMGSRCSNESWDLHGLVIAGDQVVVLVPRKGHPGRYQDTRSLPRDLSITDEAFIGYLYERAALSSD
jgi:hypothetical protein